MNKNLEEQMSLALDERLDPEAEELFQAAFVDDPEGAREWQCWRDVDALLSRTPSATPSSGFMEQFTLRLVQQERQRRLRQGFLVGILAFLLWGSMIVGLFIISNFLFSSEATRPNTIGQEFSSSVAIVRSWLDNLLITLDSMAGIPQAGLVAVGYMLLAGFLLWQWVRFLRRSVRTQQSASDKYIAA